jgi:hypothetical protein
MVARNGKKNPELRFKTEKTAKKWLLRARNYWKMSFLGKCCIQKAVFLFPMTLSGPKVLETSNFPISPETRFQFLPTLGTTVVGEVQMR